MPGGADGRDRPLRTWGCTDSETSPVPNGSTSWPAPSRRVPPLRTLAVRQNLPTERTLRRPGRRRRRRAEAARGGSPGHVDGGRRLREDAAGDQGCIGPPRTVPGWHLLRDLAPISDPTVVAGTVAAAVWFARMALGTGSGRPANELIDFLSTREVLLVLDNCEHVIDAVAALVDEILERCRSVTVLATSREAGLQGEQVHPVSPLPLPGDDLFEISDAVQLFTERAAVRPTSCCLRTTSPTSPDRRRLDGILAIELCSGAGLGSLPAPARRASRRPAAPVRGRPPTARSPAVAPGRSTGATPCSPTTNGPSSALSAFLGSFTPHAAVAIVEEQAGLEPPLSLLRKSLIVTEDDGTDTRYRMLETVRAYAEALAEAGETVRPRPSSRPLPRLGGGDTARAHLPRPRRCGPTSSTTCGPPSPGPASRTGGTSSADWPAP